ncbi:MAG: sulfatase-like hydrolase/transferase [Verrucomicrobia bacterium]|nr:sulfatase-like hydrolase/transferase [Verrucomicrobiota bacterium]
MIALLTLGLVIPAPVTAAEEATDKPNVILIYSDDHGWADLGAQGSDADIRTPHLDQLAKDGIRFTKGYVSAPQCVPSRAGVITGRYQQRFGVEDNLKVPLPLAELTIAERLKPAGYVSGQVGKWHLEPTPRSDGKRDAAGEFAYLPGAQGFDAYYCGPMNSFVASHDLKGNRLAKAPQRLSDPRFRCVWQTDAAISFVERHRAQPFFLYLAYYTPHVPLESPEPWFSRTPAHLPKERRQALAMIAAMDDGIGRLRARLRELGLEQRTLLFFIGDNGAPLKDGAWNGSLNTPLIGEKGMLTDGGVRTPFVAAWPGRLPAGVRYERPVIALDVAATAVTLAGLPHDPALDGVNLMPFLTGEKTGAPHDVLFWRWRSQAAVRDDRWKLIWLGSQKFLFDLESAEGEGKNRLAEQPEVAARLERQLLAWNATLPPPGLPRELNAQDQIFFDAHVTKTGATVSKRGANAEKGGSRKAAKAKAAAAAGPGVEGWVGRNCTLALAGGALRVSPDGAGARSGFITQTGLSVAGPVTLALKLRAPQDARVSLAWRTEGERDFVPEHVAAIDVAGREGWQEIAVPAAASGKVIHVRVQFVAGLPVEIARLELRGAGGAGTRVWDFSAASPRQP